MNFFKNSFDFTGKNVVITGGLGRIGYHIARAFLEYNANVVIADVIRDNFETLTEQFKENQCTLINFDITKTERISEMINNIVTAHKSIDVWINTAYPRTSDWSDSIENITIESWNKNISMHLGGYFWTSKYILEHMKKQGTGSLINFGSTYGVVGPNFDLYDGTSMTMPAAYSAIKGAILNFTRYFATYYGKYNVRVNSICPGGVYANQDSQFVEKYNKLTPLGRMAQAEELALPTLFLASDAASYITGHTLMVDGGWTAW